MFQTVQTFQSPPTRSKGLATSQGDIMEHHFTSFMSWWSYRVTQPASRGGNQTRQRKILQWMLQWENHTWLINDCMYIFIYIWYYICFNSWHYINLWIFKCHVWSLETFRAQIRSGLPPGFPPDQRHRQVGGQHGSSLFVQQLRQGPGSDGQVLHQGC